MISSHKLTLRSRLEGIHFDVGILEDVFDLLKNAVTSMSEDEKECIVVLDEMSFEKARSFCANNQKMYGDITFIEKRGTLAST